MACASYTFFVHFERHPGEGRGPVAMQFERIVTARRVRRDWAPAFAGVRPLAGASVP